jgi:hypothetical protein
MAGWEMFYCSNLSHSDAGTGLFHCWLPVILKAADILIGMLQPHPSNLDPNVASMRSSWKRLGKIYLVS